MTGDFDAADTLGVDNADILLTSTLQAALWMPLSLRKSAVAKSYPVGKSGLRGCQSSDIVFVNERAKGNGMCAYTCRISMSLSIVDYSITSFTLLVSVELMIVPDSCLELGHCPLILMLDSQAGTLACAQASGAHDGMTEVEIRKLQCRLRRWFDTGKHPTICCTCLYVACD